MKLIKPSFYIIEQEPGLTGIKKTIETAGRTCYHSQDKITENSANEFVERMIKSGHGAMLEHGTVYLQFVANVNEVMKDCWSEPSVFQCIEKYKNNKYSKVFFDENFEDVFQTQESVKKAYITTNLRVLVENNWMDDLKYLCDPTEYHEKRVTVRWNVDRITGESFLRHREIDEDHPTLEFAITREMEKDINSYARESTRYCNYSKNKFDNNVKFVIPSNISFNYDLNKKYHYEDIVGNTKAEMEWMKSCLDSETHYFNLIKEGWTPQFARYALCFSIFSPLVMTGFISDWNHFFDLRCAHSAHPDAQYLANQLKEKLKL